MSFIPAKVRNLFFCYSPHLHQASHSLFALNSPGITETPQPSWLCLSAHAPFGVEIDESQTPWAVRPPPALNEGENWHPMNAWVFETRSDRLLFWVCSAVITLLQSSSRLQQVGLLSTLPLRIPNMLPVWLSIPHIVPSHAVGVYVSPQNSTHKEGILARAELFAGMRTQLLEKCKGLSPNVHKDVVRRWAENALACRRKSRDDSESLSHDEECREVAQWLVDSEELCSSLATSLATCLERH